MSNVDLFYQNVRGLRTKAECFFANITLSNYSIVCLTETWLCPSVSSSDYFPPCFDVYRHDRDFSSRGRVGGGVLVAVNKQYSSRRREDLERFPESLWVEIECSSRERILIGLFYLPPQTTPDDFQRCLADIENTINDSQGSNILILGDFNAPGINWTQFNVLTGNFYCKQKCNYLLNFTSFLDLRQHNNILNDQGNALDLCFSNTDGIHVARSELSMVPEDSYHPALDVVLSIFDPPVLSPSNGPSPHTSYKYSAGDYTGMYHHLSGVDWASILESSDINGQVYLLTTVVQEAMDMYIPLKTSKKSRFPIWFSRELRTLLKRKDFLHRRFKKSGLPKWEVEFKICRKRCKKILNRDRQAHSDSVESDLVKNPKKFWRYAKSRLGKNIESEIVLNQHSDSAKGMSELFADHFASVYINNNNCSSSILPHSDVFGDSLGSVVVDEECVRLCIKKMKPTLSAGHDGIPAAIVKAYHELLTPILCTIFNNSLTSGIFPDDWKLAVVVPVLKSGNSGDVLNYRPISLLSSFSKLFEMVIHQFLSFKFRSIVIPNQHGFMSGRSTSTNLVSFMSAASEVVCNRGQLDVFYFDLSKAFDVVNHNILLYKLSSYGVCGSVYNLLKSYLSDRQAYVRVNNTTSSLYKASSGVPQGSVLGPLLFNIFVNDVSRVILNSSFLQYADDIKLYKKISTLEDCIALQNDAYSFGRWCLDNDLRLNHSKTKIMTYSRKTHDIFFPYSYHGELLSRVSELRDLGVVFDSTLRFDTHVIKVVQSALRTLGAVSRITKEFKSPSAFFTLYCSLVRSQLEYASVVWNGISKTNSSSVERVQNKFISIFKYRYLENGDPCLNGVCNSQLVNLLSLQQRRVKADLLFLFKTLHGSINSPSLLSEVSLRVPRVPTRLQSSFYIARHFSNLNPIQRSAECYNRYSDTIDIFNSCGSKFGNAVQIFLLQEKG